MPLHLLDIGNTRIKWGLSALAGGLPVSWAMPREEIENPAPCVGDAPDTAIGCAGAEAVSTARVEAQRAGHGSSSPGESDHALSPGNLTMCRRLT